MKTYIALIRGLGGKYIVPMKRLVALLEGLGLSQVSTYIQSGNAVFRCRNENRKALAGKISAAIEKGYGFAPRVIILTPAEIKAAMAANPYPEAEAEPKSLHLTFLDTVPKQPDLDTLERLCKSNERFTLKEMVFYFHAPDGVGRSKAFARIEKSLGVPATARNWRSVCKIKELASRL